MIPESVVLLAVQHLQQRRGRVAPVISAELVDLIQHQQRVHGAAATDALYDTSRHGADIGLAVAADIRFIPHAAKRDSVQLAVQCLGNRQSNRGLAHARRAHKADDLPLPLRVHLANGNAL